jgi:16S rRNA (guanine527-N7)-methyltransferase
MNELAKLEPYYLELNKMQNISREIFSEVVLYINTLLKWNKRINLVSKKHETFNDIWTRHFIDSAQLLQYIPKDTKVITDFGSGGGFPAIVIAILGDYEMHLIESDERKCAFLREITRILGKNIHIHNERIENISAWESDVLTARELASLNEIFDLTKDFHNKSKKCLFLKGQNVVEEIEEASTNWSFDYKKHQSHSSATGCILEITNLK